MDVRADPFWEFERSGWNRAAAHYEDAWSGATRAFVEPLLAAADVGDGRLVLDVACGPGYVAGAAAELGAVVVGLDVAEEMVELAAAHYPEVEFRVGDAHELPFDDGRFDAVTMNFGIHHVARPERVFEEAARVLRPGGVYAFTSWAAAPEHAPLAVAEAAVDPIAVAADLPPGPDFLRFSEPEASESALADAGFEPGSVGFETVRASWRIPAAEHLFEAQLRGGVRMSALLRAQTPDTLERIRAAMTTETRRYQTTDGSCVLPIAAHVVSGRTG
jgi:SAM-dependent methyltransferase